MVHYHIGLVAGKFLGVRRIFAQISPNMPEKYSEENDLPKKKQKTNAFLSMLGAFFQIKALQAPFLPKFSLTCPKTTK